MVTVEQAGPETAPGISGCTRSARHETTDTPGGGLPPVTAAAARSRFDGLPEALESLFPRE